MKKKLLLSLMVLFSAIFLFSQASAQPFTASVNFVEVKSDSDNTWSNTVNAIDGDSVDIKASVFLGYYEYYNVEPIPYPYVRVEAKAEIYGYDGSNWDYIGTAGTISQYIYINESRDFYWNNAFTADSYYYQYEIRVYARYDYGYWSDYDNAFVNVSLTNYCSDIKVNTYSVDLDEETTKYQNFTVSNDSSDRFYIDSIDAFSDRPGIFTVTEYDYDLSIPANGNASIQLKITAGKVSSDQSGTARIRISGYYANDESCSYSEIGEETFTVYVNDVSPTTYCSDIKVSTRSVYLGAGKTAYENFSIQNNSGEDFSITSIDVYDNSSYFSVSKEDYDSYINANSSGILETKITAEDTTIDRSGTAYIKINGEFVNGDYCSYSDIGIQSFTVHVNGIEEGFCDDISISTKTIELNENSTKAENFYVYNNSSEKFYLDDVQAYDYASAFNLEVADYSDYVNSNNSGYIKVKVNSNSVDSDQSNTAYIKVKGHYSSGRTCTYSDIGEKQFTVRVLNVPKPSPNCSSLDIETQSITLKAGESVVEEFSLVNNSSQNFYIDAVQAYDYDSGFESSAVSLDDKATAFGGSADIQVKIHAYDSAEEKTGTAYLKVKGHFTGGKQCSYNDIGIASFNVTIKGKEITKECSDFKLTVPAERAINGSGSLSISYDNPLNKSAEIKMYGSGLKVSPSKFSITANDYGTKTIEVEFSGNEDTFLVYEINISGCNIPSKTTKITLIEEDEEQDEEEEGEVTIEAKALIPDTGNIYELYITVKNNSGSTIKGTISLGTPKEWKVEGSKKVSVAAESQETYPLKVTPNKDLTQEQLSSITLKLDSGKELSENVSFKPKSNIIGTAFTALSQNLLGVGILIIVLLLLFIVLKR
ncbi:MAG: hypothetical protein AB1467_03855 [Candidatus Diapherotrites archaeon]